MFRYSDYVYDMTLNSLNKLLQVRELTNGGYMLELFGVVKVCTFYL